MMPESTPTPEIRRRGRLAGVPYGLMHVPVAPFTAGNRLDLDTYARHIDFCIRHGASSLCVVLHLAESLNLDTAERQALAKASVDAADGRVPVIVNISTPGTDEAIKLARHAEKIGADAVIAIAPYYWKPTQDAICEHFSAIMSSTDLPFMAYHSPALMDGIGLSSSSLVRLMERFDQFIGLKEASHNFENFIELRRASRQVRDNFGMVLGIEYILPAMTLGAVGTMSIFCAVCPRLVNRLFEATIKGDLAVARDMQETMSYLWQLGKVDYPAPIKAMMEIMGRPVGPTRLPIRTASDEKRRFLAAELARLGLLDTEPRGW
jgi:dihydrodipicolinate synthase/N-acetylneuraminate lyase